MSEVRIDSQEQSNLQSEMKEYYLTQFRGPEWLSATYLENILQKFLKNSKLKVKNIVVKPFGSVGDAYASSMYSIDALIKTDEETLRKGHYILKMMPLSELACEKLGKDCYNVQEKEMDIFQNIFPEFKTVLRTIEEDKNIFPKAIAVDRIRDALILENLSVKGFIMADRTFGLDMKHLKLALEKLARFHAASVCCMEKNPQIFKKYDVGMFSRKTSAFHDFFSSNMEVLIEEVSTWEGYEMYSEKLKKLRNFMYEKAFRCSDNDPGDLKVLVHSDLWSNNLMFKYDKHKSPIDAIILDFQFCSVGHPAIDLMYFFYSSACDEIRLTKIFYLCQFYYYELKKILVKLNCDLSAFPSLHDFQVQVMKKYFYAFPTTMIIMPLMKSEEPDACFENAHQRTEKAIEFKRRLYKNPKVQNIIKNTLPVFDQFGLLDEM
ncbi:unnamed protein product [Chironomus riparius]|uniref:CHK kinase-like domain-containing protein n=1 Tax=Chironomus riparius TaxID=315576 RepID=A0A9N9RJZ8_9DIPT|nr:unnamed protein product [Chironomus riparius]